MFDPVKQEVEEHGADGFKNRFITNLSTVSLNARVDQTYLRKLGTWQGPERASVWN